MGKPHVSHLAAGQETHVVGGTEARDVKPAVTTGANASKTNPPVSATEGAAVAVDRVGLEAAVREMLAALGEDVHREGIADTPKRVAKAMTFAMRGYGMSANAHVASALFHEPGLLEDDAAIADMLRDEVAVDGGKKGPAPDPSDAARPGVVLIRDIPFFSTAEDNLLPFYGRCHVGYVPANGVIVGLSKVARVSEVYARRLQTPDRLAADIANALNAEAAPRGVYVLLEAAQMGPFGPLPRVGEAMLGCFAEGARGVWGGADYRAEFCAMLDASVGPGAGPGVGLGAEEWAAAHAGFRTKGRAGHGGLRKVGSVDCVGLCRCTPPPFLHGGLGFQEEEAGGSVSTSTAFGAASKSLATSSDLSDGRQSPTITNGSSSPSPGTLPGGDILEGVNKTTGGFGGVLAEASEALGLSEGHVKPAPAAAVAAAERMLRALGLVDRISAEQLTATARRYADLMAASREGHAMAAAVPIEHLTSSAAVAEATEAKRRKVGARAHAGVGAGVPAAHSGGAAGPMIIERDLELATLCEHHLLPFHGAVHVAYVRGSAADGRSVGPALSRAVLQNIVTRHGRRLQVQERLTRDVARDVKAATGATGVMVAVRASHLCMIARGVEKPGSTTCTSACLGAFAGADDDARGRREDFWRALSEGPAAAAPSAAVALPR